MTSKTTVYPAKDGKKGSAGIDLGTGIRQPLILGSPGEVYW
jgi:hypothetical protein